MLFRDLAEMVPYFVPALFFLSLHSRIRNAFLVVDHSARGPFGYGRYSKTCLCCIPVMVAISSRLHPASCNLFISFDLSELHSPAVISIRLTVLYDTLHISAIVLIPPMPLSYRRTTFSLSFIFPPHYEPSGSLIVLKQGVEFAKRVFYVVICVVHGFSGLVCHLVLFCVNHVFRHFAQNVQFNILCQC